MRGSNTRSPAATESTSTDLETLVCTRGRDFPLARIAERLRCPRCGCRQVSVMFSPPKTPQLNAAAARPYRDARYTNESDN